MSVRILAVEDDPNFLDVLTNSLNDFGSDVFLEIAVSRSSAVSKLESSYFDLIILDLKIPASDEGLDADVEHGRYVFEKMKEYAPGTPALILTGSPAASFIPDFLARSTKVDIWGDGSPTSTVAFLTKADVDRLESILAPWIESVRAVRDVEVVFDEQPVNLSWEQDRLVRIFVRRRGGVRCTIFRIAGGLSGAVVLRLTIQDAHGVQILNSIMKIGSPAMVEREARNYSYYAQRLPESATARLIEDVRYGGCRSAAITYRLAETFSDDIFAVARKRPTSVGRVISQVEDMTKPWREGVPQTRIKIEVIRRRLLSDAKAQKVAHEYGLAWIGDLERRQVQVRWCCVHGDLHGGNILVDEKGTPILIDYGDVGDGPGALDWVTLELSLLFHPQGSARESKWPEEEICFQWADLTKFAAGSQYADFINGCRLASSGASAGPREVAATAYSYVLRQLTYEDTDKARALALLNGLRRFSEENT